MKKGIDISHWSGDINWPLVDRDFVFIKATEGSGWVDNKFAVNWVGAKEARIARGAYHFWRYAYDSVAQAEHFRSTVGDDIGELPPMLDLEDTNALKDASILTKISKCLLKIEELFEKKPIIYTAEWWWGTRAKGSTLFRGYELFVASYRPLLFGPYMVKAWDEWKIWQHTSKGSCPGIQGNVDEDVIYDEEWFNQFVEQPEKPIYQISVPGNVKDFIIEVNRT